jgi:hypothetical protein
MTESHDHRTCSICQDAIRRADPETATLLREGKLIVPHGQAVSRTTYAALYDALNEPSAT